MTRLTTALVTVGPRSLGPWGDRLWRVSLTAELVEGGSSAYWLVHPTVPADHPVATPEVLISIPYPIAAAEALILGLAAHLGDEQVEDLLLETHNIELLDGIRYVAPYWELADTTASLLCDLLNSSVRVGLTVMDDMTLATPEMVALLRDYGFDVDVFTLTDSQLATQV
jgi:hypothetical protein